MRTGKEKQGNDELMDAVKKDDNGKRMVREIKRGDKNGCKRKVHVMKKDKDEKDEGKTRERKDVPAVVSDQSRFHYALR